MEHARQLAGPDVVVGDSPVLQPFPEPVKGLDRFYLAFVPGDSEVPRHQQVNAVLGGLAELIGTRRHKQDVFESTRARTLLNPTIASRTIVGI